MMTGEWLAETWERMFRISLESSVLLAVALLASRVWGHRWPAWFGALLWALVALRLVLPATPESPWSLFNLGPRFGVPTTASAPLRVAQAGERSLEAQGPGTAETSGRAPLPVGVPRSGILSRAAGVVWLAGVGWLWGSAAFRCRALRRRCAALPPVEDERLGGLLEECARAAGVRRPPRLVQGPRDSGVALCGLFRGDRILIPQGLAERCTDAQIRGILLHELGHVARRDLARNWVLLAVQALHWHHPLVWLAGRAFRAEQEAACDRFALRHLPVADHPSYGRALLREAERNRPALVGSPVLVPFISPKTELNHRLTMILNPRTMHPLTQLTAVFLAAGIGFVAFPTATTADEANPKIPAEAARDGEGAPKAGPKDGEGAPKAGPKDGEGAPKAGPKEGDPANPAALLNTKGGKMFKAYDKDGSGGVSAEEIFGMREGDRKPSRSEVRKMEDLVEDLDTDGNPKELSVTEFLRYLEVRSQGGDRG
jgi:bla regulator protein BlaR1